MWDGTPSPTRQEAAEQRRQKTKRCIAIAVGAFRCDNRGTQGTGEPSPRFCTRPPPPKAPRGGGGGALGGALEGGFREGRWGGGRRSGGSVGGGRHRLPLPPLAQREETVTQGVVRGGLAQVSAQKLTYTLSDTSAE